MPRSLFTLAGLALMVAGCSSFPELDAQITDQARGSDYLALQPLETVMASAPAADDAVPDAEAMRTAGLALQERGSALPGASGFVDTARASQERAERAIAEAALARLRLEEDGPSLAEADVLLDRADALLAAIEATREALPDPAETSDATEIALAVDAAEAVAIEERVDALLARTTASDAPEVALADDAPEAEGIEERIDALLARTEALRDDRIDERRLLLLQRARELAGE